MLFLIVKMYDVCLWIISASVYKIMVGLNKILMIVLSVANRIILSLSVDEAPG